MKLRHFFFFALAIVAFASCKSRQYAKNNKRIEKESSKTNPNPQNYSTLAYIESFKGVSVEEMNKYGIPASITLAQGILESGSGNSDLAKYANNHFGIKCTTDWKGKAYYKDDDQRDDCFRVYTDARQSYRDHSEFLKRKRYAFLFELDKNDYKNWAQGLKTAGYATNPKYPDLLIGIIEKYNLHQYDQPESETDKLKREDRILQQINVAIPQEKNKFTPVAVAPKDPPKADNTEGTAPAIADNKPIISAKAAETASYTVQKGDGLYSIAKKFDLKIDELKALNNLSSDNIKIGQQLTVKNTTTVSASEDPQTTNATENLADNTSTSTTKPPVVTDTISDKKVDDKVTPINNIYMVQKGDSLYSIAKTFNLSVDELKELNHLTDTNIKPGQKLVITK